MRDYESFVGLEDAEVDSLYKEAALSDGAKALLGASALTLGGLMIGDNVKNLVGTKPVYHGTRSENKKSILETGLQTKFGGDKEKGSHESNKAKQRAAGRSELGAIIEAHRMRGNAIGHVFVTTNKRVAMDQAKDNIDKAKVDLKPVVIKAHVPYERWKRDFKADPDMKVRAYGQDPDPDKSVAAKSNKDIPPVEIRGGKASMRERAKHYAGKWPEYLKNNPKRFAKGVGGTAAGALLIGGIAVPQISEAIQGYQQSNHKISNKK